MFQTEVAFSKSEVKPAEQLTVNVESAKDSQVALMAVDQSVLLLESGNDITVDMVCGYKIRKYLDVFCKLAHNYKMLIH